MAKHWALPFRCSLRTPHSALGTPPSLASLRRGATLARLWLGFRLSLLLLDPLGAPVAVGPPRGPCCRWTPMGPASAFPAACLSRGVTPTDRREWRGLAVMPCFSFSLFLHRSPSGRFPGSGFRVASPHPPHSALATPHCLLPPFPRRGIMIRALTVKDILDEQIAKKLA